jgi:hypothetical protein
LVVSHADWHFQAGDVVTARWSPALDLASGIEVRLGYDDPMTILADNVPGTSEITFQLPAERPRYEQSIMRFAVAGADSTASSLPAASCEGAERCTFSTYRSFNHYAWTR